MEEIRGQSVERRCRFALEHLRCNSAAYAVEIHRGAEYPLPSTARVVEPRLPAMSEEEIDPAASLGGQGDAVKSHRPTKNMDDRKNSSIGLTRRPAIKRMKARGNASGKIPCGDFTISANRSNTDTPPVLHRRFSFEEVPREPSFNPAVTTGLYNQDRETILSPPMRRLNLQETYAPVSKTQQQVNYRKLAFDEVSMERGRRAKAVLLHQRRRIPATFDEMLGRRSLVCGPCRA